MEDIESALVIIGYALFGILALFGLIYVIANRLSEREKEDFEKREN